MHRHPSCQRAPSFTTNPQPSPPLPLPLFPPSESRHIPRVQKAGQVDTDPASTLQASQARGNGWVGNNLPRQIEALGLGQPQALRSRCATSHPLGSSPRNELPSSQTSNFSKEDIDGYHPVRHPLVQVVEAVLEGRVLRHQIEHPVSPTAAGVGGKQAGDQHAHSPSCGMPCNLSKPPASKS